MGDYFRNLTVGGLNVPAARTWTLLMAGTANQTLENVDTINYINITNNNTVTFTNAFTLRNTLTMAGASTILRINADLNMQNATAFTIPANNTVEVGNGVTWTVALHYGMAPAHQGRGKLKLASGATITVSGAGLLKLEGASGNIATLEGNGGAIGVSVAGSVYGNYFRMDRLNASGLNVTGTIQTLSNGEFHYLANTGSAVTLGAAATVPATWDSLGFFDDSAFGNCTNINAAAFNVSNIQVNNWSGMGAANENDPSGRVNWGTGAGTKLSVSNNTVAGSPPATINQATGPSLFATFAFALTQADVATDITALTSL